MVTLSKIYTRTGDDGTTMLGDGSRVAKTSQRVRAYGVVDELNSALGLAVANGVEPQLAEDLKVIQNDLFDLGSDLCTPVSRDEHGKDTRANHLPESRTVAIENMIDVLQRDLSPLKSFVLPGGCVAAAWLHLARTVCRRAELEVLVLAEHEDINATTAVYLNRLSDYLFVAGRWANRSHGEVLWEPGKNVKED